MNLFPDRIEISLDIYFSNDPEHRHYFFVAFVFIFFDTTFAECTINSFHAFSINYALMFDVSLLDQLKEGNREAFNSLFRHYYPRIMAYVSAMVEQEVAEDVVQDVFLQVWENRKKLYIGEGFHSYLFQSAYTKCLDHFKKLQSAGKYSLHAEYAYLQEYGELLKAEASVMEELYTKDFYKRLYDLLDQLPAQRREVFILTYINGLKAKEVATLTQIPQRTVESHIYLTIKYLKEHMSKKDFYLLYTLLLTEGMVLKNIS